jgi:hypothetical protein
MKFIGAVKTATRKYPMQYLTLVEHTNRGDCKGIIMKDEFNNRYLAFVWMDRERRYVISTGFSLDEANPITRRRWVQVEQGNNQPPECVDLVIPQPRASETYYSVCGKIDQHNRDHQDTLQIERKLLPMCSVDSFRVYSRMTVDQEGNPYETQKEFYGYLAAELIDNTFDVVLARSRNSPSSTSLSYPDEKQGISAAVMCSVTGAARCGLDIHLTPTKRKRKNREGVETSFSFQGRCRVCGLKTKYECSACKDEIPTQQQWICHSSTERMCFPTHLQRVHPL